MPVALRTADIHSFSGDVAGMSAVVCVLYMRKHTLPQRFCADVSTVLTSFMAWRVKLYQQRRSFGALARNRLRPKFKPSKPDSSMFVHAPKVHCRAGIVFHRVSQQERSQRSSRSRGPSCKQLPLDTWSTSRRLTLCHIAR